MTARAAGTAYHIGPGQSYETLMDLCGSFGGAGGLKDGDVIILHDDDRSLSTNLVLNASVTIKSADGEEPFTISPSNMLLSEVICVDSANLTLENINIQGNTRGGYPAIVFANVGVSTLTITGKANITGGGGGKFDAGLGQDEGNETGGSAIEVETGSLTITGDGTGTCTGGVGAMGSKDGAGVSCAANELEISGGGSFTFTGGQGTSTTRGSGAIAGSFTTSGTPTVAFHGLRGLECTVASIGGGAITATGTEAGAILDGNLSIGAGASFAAEGGGRGITFKGATISGAGNLTARATGQGDPTAGLGVGLFGDDSFALALSGNVACSGPLGGIGLINNMAELELRDGPAAGNSWVIDGSPEKAFAQFDIPNSFAPLPRANILFAGALVGGSYDTDVSVFRLPIAASPGDDYDPPALTLTPQSSTYGGHGAFTFTGSGLFGRLTSFSANGVALANGTDYTVESYLGGTRITMTEAAMRALAGQVDFRAVSTNGTAGCTVWVTIAEIPPQTGDAVSSIGLLMIGAGCLACAAVACRRRKRTQDE